MIIFSIVVNNSTIDIYKSMKKYGFVATEKLMTIPEYRKIKDAELLTTIDEVVGNSQFCIFMNTDTSLVRVNRLPKINKRELNKYVLNNIEEYFTFNPEDYIMKNKIISSDKFLTIALDKDLCGKFREYIDMKKKCLFLGSMYSLYSRVLEKEKESGIVMDITDSCVFTAMRDTKCVRDAGTLDTSLEEYNNVCEKIRDIFNKKNLYLEQMCGKGTNNMVLILGEEKYEEEWDLTVREIEKQGKYKIEPHTRESIFDKFYKKDVDSVDLNFIDEYLGKDIYHRYIVQGCRTLALLAVLTAVSIGGAWQYYSGDISRYDSENLERDVKSLRAENTELTGKISGFRDTNGAVQATYVDILSELYTVLETTPKTIKVNGIEVLERKVKLSIDTQGHVDSFIKMIERINKTGYYEKVDISGLCLDNENTIYNVCLRVK